MLRSKTVALAQQANAAGWFRGGETSEQIAQSVGLANRGQRASCRDAELPTPKARSLLRYLSPQLRLPGRSDQDHDLELPGVNKSVCEELLVGART